MKNNSRYNQNPDSAMINAALELLTSTPAKPTKPKESSPDLNLLPASDIKEKSIPLNPLDWRLELSQAERFQVIQRLSQEVFLSISPDQKHEARVSQIAQQIEKRFFEISKSKLEYFTNLKAQIFEIQKKCMFQESSSMKNHNSQQQQPTTSSTPLPPAQPIQSGPTASGDNAANHQTTSNSEKNMMAPMILMLSDNDKKLVKEKLAQISHLFPKINGLVNTISTLGTKADVLQIHKLINIKKAIYYQLEGLKHDRYTISVEAANSLQATLVRYFQYGGMLLKQNQERSSQIKLLMEGKDGKTTDKIYAAPAPAVQPNVLKPGYSPPASNVDRKALHNMSGAGSAPIMPRTKQESSNMSMKLNAQIKQQLFIQKINQKHTQAQVQQAQARMNTSAKPTFSQLDLDLLLSDAMQSASEIHSPETKDSSHTREEDFSEYFDFGEELLSPQTDDSSGSGNTKRKSHSDGENDSLDLPAKKQKIDNQGNIVASSESQIPHINLFQELRNLEKEFSLSFETFELDSIEDDNSSARNNRLNENNQPQTPTINPGRTLVFCYLPKSTLRIAFRLSSKTDYERALIDRHSAGLDVDGDFFEKFRNDGLGLEDVEVVSDMDLENYESIIKITSFATRLGVGVTGNIVQISDILRYIFSDVLKSSN